MRRAAAVPRVNVQPQTLNSLQRAHTRGIRELFHAAQKSLQMKQVGGGVEHRGASAVSRNRRAPPPQEKWIRVLLHAFSTQSFNWNSWGSRRKIVEPHRGLEIVCEQTRHTPTEQRANEQKEIQKNCGLDARGTSAGTYVFTGSPGTKSPPWF